MSTESLNFSPARDADARLAATAGLPDGPAAREVPEDESLRPGIDDRFGRRHPVPGQAARSRLRVPRGVVRLVGPVALLGLWWVVTAIGLVKPQVLPSPATVLASAAGLAETGQLQDHLLISLRRAMTGLAAGVAAGVVLAVIAGLWRAGEALVDATMQMLRAMPILALVPLAIIWFGIGEEVKVILVALGVTFPVYLNTHAAIRGVDSRYVDLATTVGLSRIGVITRIVLPGAMPGFFTGLRFAVAVSWLVLVVSEQINAESGIGFLMSQARGFNQTDIVVVGLVVYALLGLISDTVVRAVERPALAWRSTLEAR